MIDETPSQDAQVIPLTESEYLQLERALQWPEDLPAWDRLNTPTNFADLFGSMTRL